MQTTTSGSLTSLLNRISFNKEINRSLIRAKRHKKQLALFLIDIDHFQKIIINYGPEDASSILEELSKRFTSVLRADDILAHFEKDEFAVLITDLEQPKLIGTVAEKLLQVAAEPFKTSSSKIQLSISIGICIYPDDGLALEGLEKCAEEALLKAKHQGGNKYQFSSPHMTLEAQDFIKLQTALREALKNNEFIIYYQPILDLKTWTIVSVEALLRWDHPVYGMLDPLKFIPSAEETGLIIQIGAWVLAEVCHSNKQWQNDGYRPITVAVNLSPKQFYHPQLVETIKNVLLESQLSPAFLELEITEMTAMDKVAMVNRILSDLKNLGLSLSIDDFGTGRTSMSYLKDFPINTIKIDRSFIESFPEDSKNEAFISALIILAHQLEIKVVVEGVETMEQIQFLAKQNCDSVQGYFISRPLPASKIVAQFEKVR